MNCETEKVVMYGLIGFTVSLAVGLVLLATNAVHAETGEGKIKVSYYDVSSYYGKGKIVIKNLETGQTLVRHDLNFAKQHANQGDKCCVKVYTFDSDDAQKGDRLSAKVTAGDGSWTDSSINYKKNLKISMSLEEIGE